MLSGVFQSSLGAGGLSTNQDALQPIVEIPHEENSAPASSSQADLLQVVVVTCDLHAVISHLTDQWQSSAFTHDTLIVPQRSMLYLLLGGRFILVFVLPL